MAVGMSVPVTVSEEAAARVAELGMRREFEQMLEHAKQALPGVWWIDVTLEYSPDEPDADPTILISPHRPFPGGDYDPAEWDWSGWFVRTFPPRVCQHFCLLTHYEADNGRQGIPQ